MSPRSYRAAVARKQAEEREREIEALGPGCEPGSANDNVPWEEPAPALPPFVLAARAAADRAHEIGEWMRALLASRPGLSATELAAAAGQHFSEATEQYLLLRARSVIDPFEGL